MAADTLTIPDLITRLATVPPADIPALRLDAELRQLEAAGDISAIIDRLGEIETALEALSLQVSQTRRSLAACQSLSPVPAQHSLPWGI